MGDVPVACSLDASALAQRRDGLLADLIARAESRVEHADGISLRFPADAELLALLVQVIEAERRCCRFLTFQLTVAPDGGPFELRLSGPGGTREFLSGLLG